MDARPMPKWKDYENLIAGLYEGADSISVQADQVVQDADGTSRQIDALATVRVGAHEFRIVIECKSGAKPVERSVVDSLLITRDKIRADKAVIFANGPFQKGAIHTAQANGVQMFRTREPGPHEWWPPERRQALVQVWTAELESRLQLPWPRVGIGTAPGVDWPPGIKAPIVRFRGNRTTTPVQNFGRNLEDMLEETARAKLIDAAASDVGVIGDGRDCVGHFTIKCTVAFRPEDAIVKERDTPLVLLRIPELTVHVAVRVEQRSIEWPSIGELGDALIVDDVIAARRYQLSRSTAVMPWTWTMVEPPPLGADLGNHRRVVVLCNENMRAECFDKPWSTFGAVNLYEPHEVPSSATIDRVCRRLRAPSDSGLTPGGPGAQPSARTDAGD